MVVEFLETRSEAFFTSDQSEGGESEGAGVARRAKDSLRVIVTRWSVREREATRPFCDLPILERPEIAWIQEKKMSSC